MDFSGNIRDSLGYARARLSVFISVGHGAAVRPQTNDAIWRGVIGLWGRVAPLLSPWCGRRELPTGVNLNQYSGPSSCIRWHSDNEPLFGPQNSPKLIVSMSLSNSVEFKVRRGRGSVPSLITLDHGDLLVMDGLTQSEYVHCTASGLQGPRVNLTFCWVAQHIASCPLAGVVGCVLPSCVQGLAEPGPRGDGGWGNKWSFFWGLVLLLLILVSSLLVGTLINIGRGHRYSGQRPSCSVVHFPSWGRARWVGGRRWPLSRRRQTSKSVSFYFPCVFFWENKFYSFFKSMGFSIPLGMLVAKWVPPHAAMMQYSVGTPKWAFWGKGWQNHCGTTFSLLFGRFFLVSKRTLYFLGVICWMLHIGRARHPGPGPRNIVPGQLSIEFINIGGWLTSGDLAMDSCAQFLAVAEHRLIPSRVRSEWSRLRSKGLASVWAPASQDSSRWQCWGWCGQFAWCSHFSSYFSYCPVSEVL